MRNARREIFKNHGGHVIKGSRDRIGCRLAGRLGRPGGCPVLDGGSWSRVSIPCVYCHGLSSLGNSQSLSTGSHEGVKRRSPYAASSKFINFDPVISFLEICTKEIRRDSEIYISINIIIYYYILYTICILL